ncbi:MAG TPA: NnrS family protein [Hyphomicrobium sp.]|nr:NnrS family protein [Hyphomicrobium sp.]
MMDMATPRPGTALKRTLSVVGDEGFRLFFPLAALHAALWPLIWVAALGFSLPLSEAVPPGFWHAHEMVVGSFGAALIGFLTTAVPEWTGTPRLRGRALFVLAVLWGTARVLGFAGHDLSIIPAGLADASWIAALLFYIVRIAIGKRISRLNAFAFWIGLFLLGELAARYAMTIANSDFAWSQRLIHLPGLIFLGVLGIALARITAPVTNLVLDPTQTTSPFRPHPGRLNLAPGLLAVAVGGDLAGLSLAVTGYLYIAAGAAFMDRIAESFIGRQFVRAEILALAGVSAFAGIGLMLLGLGRLGLGVSANCGLHFALMGGLGLGVLSVFSIAGLRHTGQPLGLAWQTRLALVLASAATVMRALPELVPTRVMPEPPYLAVSLLWASAFLLWLRVYWPFIRNPATFQPEGC